MKNAMCGQFCCSVSDASHMVRLRIVQFLTRADVKARQIGVLIQLCLRKWFCLTCKMEQCIPTWTCDLLPCCEQEENSNCSKGATFTYK